MLINWELRTTVRYEKFSNNSSDAWVEKADEESFSYILDLTSQLDFLGFLIFFFLFSFFPPALSLATFSSFPSCKFAFPIAVRALLLEAGGGDASAVNRVTEILHPSMHSPLFSERDVCSRVAP